MVEQLLCGDAVTPDDVEEHRPGSIDAHPMLRGKQVNQKIVHGQEHQGEDEDYLHVADFDSGNPE